MKIVLGSHTPWWQNVGGTELFTAELVAQLGNRHSFLTVTRTGEQQITVTPFRESALGTSHHYFLPQAVSQNTIGSFSEPLFDTYVQLLEDLGPDVVHAQHLMNIGTELIHAATALDIPVINSIHDYYYVCPSYNLLNNENKFCNIPEDAATCNMCLSKKYSAGDGTLPVIQTWRTDTSAALRLASVLHYPSDYAKTMLERAFPFASAIPSAILPTYFPSPDDGAKPPVASATGRPTILVLGTKASQKGAAFVEEVVPKLVDEEIHVSFLGSSPQDWSLSAEARTRCSFLGPYPRGHAVELIRQARPSAVLLPSVWPETHMRTLSETWEAGFPALVLDYGAQAERIRSSGGGVVLASDDPREATEEILALIGSAQFRDIVVPLPPDPAILVQQYNDLYQTTHGSSRSVIPPLEIAAKEIATLTGQSTENATNTLRREELNDGSTVAASWNAEVNQAADVTSFYQTTTSYLYDLEIASRLRTRRIWRQQVLRFALTHDLIDAPVLDFGCGNGADACFYADHGLSVTAFDLASPHLKLAQARAASLELPIEFLATEPTQLVSDSYGLVTCFEVLEHVANPEQLVSDIARVTSPGGYALMTESFSLVGPKYPSHLKENLQYVGQLDRMCLEVGLVRIGLVCDRIQMFQKQGAA